MLKQKTSVLEADIHVSQKGFRKALSIQQKVSQSPPACPSGRLRSHPHPACAFQSRRNPEPKDHRVRRRPICPPFKRLTAAPPPRAPQTPQTWICKSVLGIRASICPVLVAAKLPKAKPPSFTCEWSSRSFWCLGHE